MTVDDLAREAGVGKGTVYLHFPGKEAVALAVVNRWSERVFDRLRALAAGSGPASRRLVAMLEHRVLGRFDQLRPGLDSLPDLLAAIRPALVIQRERLLEVEARLFCPVLAQLAPGLKPSRAEVRRAARAMLAGTNWLLPWYHDPGHRDTRAEVARRTRDVALLLVAGARQVLRRAASGRQGRESLTAS